MKFTKMSLVAALLVGSSAFALDNVKMSGNAQLFYNTSDGASGYDKLNGRTSGTLFSKDSSAADAALNLNVTADLVKNDTVAVSAGAGYTVLSTLGLENNLVSNVWGSAHTATLNNGSSYGAKVENANWMNEAWVAATAGKTTLKLGRMELDTPLAFTEKWSIEKNTFEAAVVINQDIPDTTLVGAYVGNGNGNEALIGNTTSQSNVQTLGLAMGSVVNGDGKFNTFAKNGAYAVGAINNSFKPLTVQGWYYNLTQLATAYWLQADLNMDGVLAGAQYTSTTVGSNDASGTYAVMAGYEIKDTVTAKLAYSQTSDKGDLHGANTATDTGASKLYTEAWLTYGQVTQIDTSAINLTVESPADGIVDLGLYVTMVDHSGVNTAGDFMETAVTAGKSFGPLDTTLAVIYSDEDAANTAGATDPDAVTTIQAFLTLNF